MKVTIITAIGFMCLDVDRISIETDKPMSANVKTEDGTTTYTYEEDHNDTI